MKASPAFRHLFPLPQEPPRPRATPDQIARLVLIYDTLHIPVPVNLSRISAQIAQRIIVDMAKFIAGDTPA